MATGREESSRLLLLVCLAAIHTGAVRAVYTEFCQRFCSVAEPPVSLLDLPAERDYELMFQFAEHWTLAESYKTFTSQYEEIEDVEALNKVVVHRKVVKRGEVPRKKLGLICREWREVPDFRNEGGRGCMELMVDKFYRMRFFHPPRSDGGAPADAWARSSTAEQHARDYPLSRAALADARDAHAALARLADAVLANFDGHGPAMPAYAATFLPSRRPVINVVASRLVPRGTARDLSHWALSHRRLVALLDRALNWTRAGAPSWSVLL